MYAQKECWHMIGELRSIVTIYDRQQVDNGRGGFTFDYVKVGKRWAGIHPMSNSEVTKYREEGIETNVRMFFRYNPDPNMNPKLNGRIYFGSNTCYEIVGVIDSITNRDYLEVLGVTRR
jgi:SPP1 family predicted phage head-tail adaptor